MSKLSHSNRHGEAQMVDIAAKAVTHRIAIAEGTIAMNRETLTMIQEGLHKKGDVLGIARIAGGTACEQQITTGAVGVVGTLPEPEKGTDFMELSPWAIVGVCAGGCIAPGQLTSASQLAYQLGPIWMDLSKSRVIKHLA